MEKSESSPKIAGILLAAGGATRMGRPKLLLPWKGEALIHRAARVALQAGLAPVIIVSGAGAEGIQNVLLDLPVQWAHNLHWQEGQSTSVRAGVEALPADCQAVVFLLGDQPFVGTDLILSLVATYLRDRPMILAPHVNGKRVNPVIFDRSIFPHLLALKGDAGARSIFGVFPPAAMPWPDEKVLLDVDTPEDYEQLSKLSE